MRDLRNHLHLCCDKNILNVEIIAASPPHPESGSSNSIIDKEKEFVSNAFFKPVNLVHYALCTLPNITRIPLFKVVTCLLKIVIFHKCNLNLKSYF